MRRHGALLVIPWRNRHVDAATGQPPHGDRGVSSPTAHDRVGSGRHPERQTMNPPTRPPEPNIRQSQEASDLVPAHTKTVAVQDRRRITVNLLVFAKDSFLEQRRYGRDTAPRDRRAETQPCHDLATVRLSNGPAGNGTAPRGGAPETGHGRHRLPVRTTRRTSCRECVRRLAREH